MIINGLKVEVGADPELFVQDMEGNLVSAHPYCAGTKKFPVNVGGTLMQVDGMALEFNIKPAMSRYWFDSYVEYGLNTITKKLNRYGVKPSRKQYHTFSKEQWDAAPESSKELGCDPDFNAYRNGEVNEKPKPANERTRCVGGHIHIGWANGMDITDQGHLDACIAITKAMDYYFALPMSYTSEDPRRRELYGEIGSFRPKSYGVEYRTPSNQWMWTKVGRKFAFNAVEKSIKEVFRQDGTFDVGEASEGVIRFEWALDVLMNFKNYKQRQSFYATSAMNKNKQSDIFYGLRGQVLRKYK